MSDSIVYSFGILLISALVAGQVAYRLRIPRVTSYLLVGLLVGPHVLGSVSAPHLHDLEPFAEMAMALVLFNMGCRFSLGFFRRILRRALWLSFGELTTTFLLVSCSMLALQQSWPVALLFGVLAMATAPATTMLVLQESDSEGPITDYTVTLVALNNLAAVILFEVVMVVIALATQTSDGSPHSYLTALGTDLLSSLVLGICGGMVISFACELVASSRWLVLLVAVGTLTLGLCHHFDIPYLLAFLAMGATVANASERAGSIREDLDRVTGLLCVVFFVIHGADMDVNKLREAGMVGIAYIVMRSVGKCLGIFLAAERKPGNPARRWLGPALLSQAGAALALVAIAERRLPELVGDLSTVVVGTVVFFEILGPILVRQAVLAAGEVPLSQAIHHQSTTPLMEVRRIWNRLLTAFGLDPWKRRDPQELTVAELMRKNFYAIPAAATFDEMVDVLEHSHDNVFPVTQGEGQLYGVIHYSNLRSVVFDAGLGSLVCAADLAEDPPSVLDPTASILDAWELARDSQEDLLPVVSSTDQKLVGMVARRDLYRYFLRRSKDSSSQE